MTFNEAEGLLGKGPATVLQDAVAQAYEATAGREDSRLALEVLMTALLASIITTRGSEVTARQRAILCADLLEDAVTAALAIKADDEDARQLVTGIAAGARGSGLIARRRN